MNRRSFFALLAAAPAVGAVAVAKAVPAYARIAVAADPCGFPQALGCIAPGTLVTFHPNAFLLSWPPMPIVYTPMPESYRRMFRYRHP
jgi:hypothetical protein